MITTAFGFRLHQKTFPLYHDGRTAPSSTSKHVAHPTSSSIDLIIIEMSTHRAIRRMVSSDGEPEKYHLYASGILSRIVRPDFSEKGRVV